MSYTRTLPTRLLIAAAALMSLACSNKELPTLSTPAQESATAVQSLTQNNLPPDIVVVQTVTTDEDTSVALGDALTIGAAFTNGGESPDVVATRVGFLGHGMAGGVGGSIDIDMTGISATGARVRVYGTDPTGNNNDDNGLALIVADVNFDAELYSGQIIDYGGDNASQFAWIDQDFGNDASNAVTLSGEAAASRELSLDVVGNTLSLSFPVDTPERQYAAHVEFTDGTADSMDPVSHQTVLLEPINARRVARFALPANAAVVTIDGAGSFGRVADSFAIERRMFTRIVVRQVGGQMIASGLVSTDDGRGPNNNGAYGFENYVVGNDPLTAALVTTAAPAAHDTTANGQDLNDFSLYLDGGDLVLEETQAISNAWDHLYAVQVFERTGVSSIASSVPSTFGVGDVNPGSDTAAELSFPIPDGAASGRIRVGFLVRGVGINENAGILEFSVDLSDDTSDGNAQGIRVDNPDVTSWQNISLIAPVQLVTATGFAAGVSSNHADNLGDYTDPQFGGITLSRELVSGVDSIRVQIVGGPAPFQYNGGLATWTGLPQLRLVLASTSGGITGSGTQVLPDGSTRVSIASVANGAAMFIPPHNYNGAIELGVSLDGRPSTASTFDVEVEDDSAELEELTAVSAVATNPTGDTVAALLATSVNSPRSRRQRHRHRFYHGARQRCVSVFFRRRCELDCCGCRL